jgi:hypothetical protein
VLTPNAMSIFWACAKFENAARAAQAKVKRMATRTVCFKEKPPVDILGLKDWMQVRAPMLPNEMDFTRIYGRGSA